MAINIDELRKLEKLSMLKLNDKDEAKLMEKLSSVLDWAEIVTTRDTGDITMMESMGANILRMNDDVDSKDNTRQDVLANAKMIEDNMFVVPKVVD